MIIRINPPFLHKTSNIHQFAKEYKVNRFFGDSTHYILEYEILLIREKQFADSLIACLTTLPCLVKENVKSHTIFFFLSFLDCIDG